jgi:hypothetical protein
MQGGDVWLEAWWIVVHRVECAQRVGTSCRSSQPGVGLHKSVSTDDG